MKRAGTSLRVAWIAVLLPVLLLAARCPVPGQTFFSSGDAGRSFSALDVAMPVAMQSAAAAPVAEAAVLEGDLFRVLAPDRLLNLNAYRGLQVIDISDAAQPKIIGRLPLAGTPVELYVVGDVAIVLLNGWQGYSGVPESGNAGGAMLISVDLGDPANPQLLDQAAVPGAIDTSRLTRKGDRAALYVVAQQWSQWTGATIGASYFQDTTVVASFDLAGGALAPIARLDLGGSVTAVHATPDRLLVARNDHWSEFGTASHVTLIDISDAAGAMQIGGEVAVEGQIASQFNMDHRGGVLRIASGSRFGSMRINHLQTFDASDPSQITPIDAVTFGANEDLFATIFLDDRAFFVTYFRVDPFHAFAISDAGAITPGAEFVVSGWNDFFRPVFDASRLIGIGVDDQGTRTLAVSLYDVTEISNPEPLLARERIAADGAWSEASFDHRAFSVLEGAVSVPAPGGGVETGLVLLPYSGWDDAQGATVAAVQLFTFSDHTLTRRGTMVHGSQVRRSFEADDARVANLSETELSLFATADPDVPVLLGRLDLAPKFTDVFRFGDHWVRIVAADDGYGYWNSRAAQRPAVVEVIAGDADPDLGVPVARFEIPSHAEVHRSGPLLVTLASEGVPWMQDAAPETDVAVHDLRDPAHPNLAAAFRTDRLQSPWSYWPSIGMPVFGLAYGFMPPMSVTRVVAAVPGGLAFLQQDSGLRATLDVLDLRDPQAPGFADPVGLGLGNAGVSLLVEGTDVWVALKHAKRADRQGRAHAMHYALRVDVADPASPVAGEPINVPGELVAVDGMKIFTRDLQWNENGLETAVVRLALEAGLARVEAVRWFAERNVEKVLLDGAGNVLVSHGPCWNCVIALPMQQTAQVLTVLDADSEELDVSSELPIESWASLLGAIPGRVLFRVGSGLLVVDLDDAVAPRAQAFFATPGWIARILVEGRSAFAALGRYGILRFNLDADNLP